MKVKEESEKAGLKLTIQKTKIMASVPSLNGKQGKVETVTDFIFLGPKITVDSDCNHEIKRLLLLGRKPVTQHRQHTKKQRYHFTDKSPYSQSYDLSSSHVWM